MSRLMQFPYWRQLGVTLAALSMVAIPHGAHAVKMDNDVGYVYYSPGLLLTPVGSIRLGRNNWEFGLLGGNAVGFAKVFRSDSTYAAFGIAAGWAGSWAAGAYGAVGKEWKLLGFLALRGEVGASYFYSGHSMPIVLLGLTIHI